MLLLVVLLDEVEAIIKHRSVVNIHFLFSLLLVSVVVVLVVSVVVVAAI